jgi:cytochrome c-type biogenesis protein CcmH/NrfG
MGEFERAIPLLNEVLLKDSVDTEAMFYLASSLSHSGKSQEAADIFNEILSLLQPDPALLYKLYNQLGIAYSALNKLQESYDYFNQAYKLNSEDSKLLFQMAMVRGGFKEKGSLIEARSLLEQYLKAIKPKGDNLTAEETILKERAKMYIERLKEEIFMSE